jgi:hypothetical protein
LAVKGEEEEIYNPIICCKDSNYLLLIDTTLLKLISSPNLPASIRTLILSLVPTSFSSLAIFVQFLEDEIARHFKIFKEKLVIASKATPFSMRKMSFLCRVMCEERRRREGAPHPVWREFERAIEEVSERGWLGRVKGA